MDKQTDSSAVSFHHDVPGFGRCDQSRFDLVSIGLSILSPGGSSPPVVFTGTLAGGGTVTQTFTPVVFSFQTFVFSSAWTNLVSVSWRQGTDEPNAHQFDNIVLNSTVPEPASLVLLGSGLVGLGGLARRRRNRANQTCNSIDRL